MECCCSTKLSLPSYPSILNLQGFSSPVGRKFSENSLHPQLLSSSLPNPFLQLNNKPNTFHYRHSSASFPLRAYRGVISAEAWDFGRFVKTLFFFNGPPSPARFVESLIEKFLSPSPKEPLKAMETSGIVLVAGATGGVGRRVVEILQKKGSPIRVLVRNEEKARRMLGPDVDLV